MQVTDPKISDIFDGAVQWIVPLFQRHYEWGKKHWETLWSDVEELLHDSVPKPHFFGTIVGQRIETGSSFSLFSLIDGQQRLTTISVLLILLRNKAKQRGDDSLVTKINDRHLINKDEKNDRFTKLKLSSDHNDHANYLKMINSVGSLPKLPPNSLCKAYCFFEEKLQGDSIDLERLWDKLSAFFKVVLR